MYFWLKSTSHLAQPKLTEIKSPPHVFSHFQLQFHTSGLFNNPFLIPGCLKLSEPLLHPSLPFSAQSTHASLLGLPTSKLFNLSEPHRAMNIQRETSCGCTHSENASSFLFLSLQRIWENYSFLAIRNQVRLILEALLPWALLSHACIVQSIQWTPDGPVSFPHPSLPRPSPCQPRALHTFPVLISFSAQPEPGERHLHT